MFLLLNIFVQSLIIIVIYSKLINTSYSYNQIFNINMECLYTFNSILLFIIKKNIYKITFLVVNNQIPPKMFCPKYELV